MSAPSDAPTILLTGFDPFGRDAHNPSASVAEEATRVLRQDGLNAVSTVLPCEFATSHRVLFDVITEYRPDVVVCLGLAAGRRKVGVEQVAINLQQARIADNAGDQPVGRPVVAGGPDGIFTTLPARRIVATAGELPLELSLSAGTFVCNHVFYALMHAITSTRWDDAGPAAAGFVHVPWDTEISDAYEGVALADSVASVAHVVKQTVAQILDPDATEADASVGAGLGTLH